MKWCNCLTLASAWHGHQNDYRTRIVVLCAVTSCRIPADRQHHVVIRKAKTSSFLCGPHTLRLSLATAESFLFFVPSIGYRTWHFHSFSYHFLERYLKAEEVASSHNLPFWFQSQSSKRSKHRKLFGIRIR